jgi:hypothetical protein
MVSPTGDEVGRVSIYLQYDDIALPIIMAMQYYIFSDPAVCHLFSSPSSHDHSNRMEQAEAFDWILVTTKY